MNGNYIIKLISLTFFIAVGGIVRTELNASPKFSLGFNWSLYKSVELSQKIVIVSDISPVIGFFEKGHDSHGNIEYEIVLSSSQKNTQLFEANIRSCIKGELKVEKIYLVTPALVTSGRIPLLFNAEPYILFLSELDSEFKRNGLSTIKEMRGDVNRPLYGISQDWQGAICLGKHEEHLNRLLINKYDLIDPQYIINLIDMSCRYFELKSDVDREKLLENFY